MLNLYENYIVTLAISKDKHRDICEKNINNLLTKINCTSTVDNSIYIEMYYDAINSNYNIVDNIRNLVREYRATIFIISMLS